MALFVGYYGSLTQQAKDGRRYLVMKALGWTSCSLGLVGSTVCSLLAVRVTCQMGMQWKQVQWGAVNNTYVFTSQIFVWQDAGMNSDVFFFLSWRWFELASFVLVAIGR